MSSALLTLLLGWVVLATLMAALWLIQRRTRDAGIVDVGWAAGLGFLGVLSAVLGEGHGPRRWLLAVLAGFWGFRLAVYLWQRTGEEDGRYQTLRRQWGQRAQPYFFVFFQAQAVLAVILSIPFVIVAGNDAPLSLWDFMGVIVWVVAIAGESIADRQLARFRKNPANRGKTCRQGLWRFSRHPNYFFEWTQWWSYVFLAISSSAVWLTLLSPLVMIYLILRVTGIPPTEAQALSSRGEDYRDYQRTTNAFFPWFPKTDSA